MGTKECVAALKRATERQLVVSWCSALDIIHLDDEDEQVFMEYLCLVKKELDTRTKKKGKSQQ